MSSRLAEILSVLMFASAILGTICLAVALLRHPPTRWRAPRRFCPGPPRRPRLFWSIASLLYRPCCGYNLRGAISATPDGDQASETAPVRCPECGSMLAPVHRRLRSQLRLRLLPVGVALLGAAIAARFLGGSIAAGLRVVPSEALLAAEQAMGDVVPIRLQRELRRRFSARQLTPEQEIDMLPMLVRDLADDHQSGNAARAKRRLAVLGPFARESLERALHSPDPQQRRMAVDALMQSDWEPSDAMLRDMVEQFRSPGHGAHDGTQREETLAPGWRARVTYLRWRIRHRPDLIDAALASPDEGLRFCAALLESTSISARDWTDVAVPTLVARLADNGVVGDAEEAAEALVRWGRKAWPYLQAALTHEDEQTRRLAARCLARSEAREAEWAAARRRTGCSSDESEGRPSASSEESAEQGSTEAAPRTLERDEPPGAATG